MAIFYINWLTI